MRRGVCRPLWSNAVLLRASTVSGIAQGIPFASGPDSRANAGTGGSFICLSETFSAYCRNISLRCCLCRERCTQGRNEQSKTTKPSHVEHVCLLPIRYAPVRLLRSEIGSSRQGRRTAGMSSNGLDFHVAAQQAMQAALQRGALSWILVLRRDAGRIWFPIFPVSSAFV